MFWAARLAKVLLPRLTRYLNTDLDLEAPFDLAPLASALCECDLFALHVTTTGPNKWSATFESSSEFTSADANLTELLSAVESLDWSARHAWSACTKREFNIGYEGGDEPLSVSVPFPLFFGPRLVESVLSLLVVRVFEIHR